MTLYFIGDEKEEEINFPNNMKIKIVYGFRDLPATFGHETRFHSQDRKITLFDSNGKIITELIETNPHQHTGGELEIFEDEKIIY